MSEQDSWLDKTKTNINHFKEEIADWKVGIKIHIFKFKRAHGFAAKTHEAMNVVKETFALLPYTLSHLWVYQMIGLFLMAGFVFWYVGTSR